MGFSIFMLVMAGLLTVYLGVMIYALVVKYDDRTKPAIPFAVILIAVTLTVGISGLVSRSRFVNAIEEKCDEYVRIVTSDAYDAEYKIKSVTYEIEDISYNKAGKICSGTADIIWHYEVDCGIYTLDGIKESLYSEAKSVLPSSLEVSKKVTANPAVFDTEVFVNGEKYFYVAPSSTSNYVQCRDCDRRFHKDSINGQNINKTNYCIKCEAFLDALYDATH